MYEARVADKPCQGDWVAIIALSYIHCHSDW